ncbi:MATE family efflux transporter [Bacillus inaquosorum]|uniref:MATE family efflux transporter n=2 Tax=Bacillus inaquosorum TaxID=483913 RepID=UPI000745BC41|nr:MATE family efflux transporter [Bacillus inaquosorum]PPA35125.1 MATE family efflux transporter [Bacillus subtilis]AMA51573.1 MATE family efflux transporter [Bacillus inaquosorum]MBT2190068.1 MATE family efflux transporter [Bacillus inaquosorum]MBT3116821.1 MATE family efflux transporter [Bacillus inaquosorum]MBT3124591.1 MATE family efflux transporter [Bacillus inaquosorum]
MNNTDALREENTLKLLFTYSLPMIIGLFVGASYNIIDRAFIGHGVGDIGIAGIAISFPVMMGIMAFANLIGTGATALTSIRLGENNNNEAERVMGNALTLLILVSVGFIVLFWIFLDPILAAFGANEEILPHAVDYTRIILLASIFMIVGSGMNNFIRADGNPKKSMFTLLIGSILNVILAPIFIFGFDWGMKGAGLATGISQLISFIWVMSHFFTGKSVLKIRLKNMRLSGHLVGRIFALGGGSFITQMATSVMMIVMNNVMLNHGGSTAIAGMNVVNAVQTFIMLPIWGISLGIQPIIGYNFGAGNYKRVKSILVSAMVLSTVIAVVASLFIYFIPDSLVAIFNQNEELIQFGSHAMVIFLFFTPLLGLQIVGAGFFQALGKAKQSIFLSLIRQVLILIPLMLILPPFLGLKGVLISGPISDFCSAAISVTFVVFSLKQMQKEMIQEQDPGSRTKSADFHESNT